MTGWVIQHGWVWTVYLLIDKFFINKYTVVFPYQSEIAPHRHSHARSIESWLNIRSIKLGSQHCHPCELRLLLLLLHGLLHLLLHWLLTL